MPALCATSESPFPDGKSCMFAMSFSVAHRVQAYMSRLGLFGHESMMDLIETIEKCGLGASEFFACGLKAEGIYMSRCASCEFDASEKKACGQALMTEVLHKVSCMGDG